jgi:hypothetical protein
MVAAQPEGDPQFDCHSRGDAFNDNGQTKRTVLMCTILGHISFRQDRTPCCARISLNAAAIRLSWPYAEKAISYHFLKGWS